ncbi:multicopy suppressor of a budding defect [Exophiala xenobiotica]|nr:multicopy suppressor of a budding defect [Exophiala xenobiotica]KAK5415198.1 multicopy suppressor of a budding defect [Exophiala xenobiotica]KAK5437783.1 multicopy suppressor of a budding defect [Exophiala xenobiotica]KAK5514572.1 multicopy suppressor of a budding defect [Exophiala xenobiotica]KAK5525779.1 multicopy suppressor of a budding defect [Exophiala xenobiotica]
MPFFSRVFKSKDGAVKKSTAPVANGHTDKKPQWSDAWIRTRVDPEEVSELLHLCTAELKSRALDVPFLLLPFRPSSDPSAARTFVRSFFLPPQDREPLRGSMLENELRMTEVMVLISVMKWCWARLPGGVVTWEVYEGFLVGEKGALSCLDWVYSGYARDAFSTFIPLGVDSPSRVLIIQDYFDLLAAIAAHGKVNGLGGHKLSRYAGWWAFEHYDSGKGFETGYKSWANAADATSHLFFAYLRSLSPGAGKASGILNLPRSLQQLLDSTTYPPKTALLSNSTTKVVMIVDVVSPTPYALLRRAKNFEYRDDDRGLQQFASYDDPVEALTDECRRVLKAISSANQSTISDAKTSTSLTDPSWSRFQDIGFGSSLDDDEDDDGGLLGRRPVNTRPLRTAPRSGGYQNLARPTTPSWADFLSSGFTDEHGNTAPAPILLPPDKILPPINSTMIRGQSSQSHRRNLDAQPNLRPGELASIIRMAVDDSFWWVWISSLAPEEPTSRKAVFGRCALIETVLPDGHWMVMEEQVKGAAPEPAVGAYIAETKKSFLGFTTKRGRLTRRRSQTKKSPLSPEPHFESRSRATLAPDQQARIQEAAAELTRKKEAEDREKAAIHARRGRAQDTVIPSMTNSIFTIGPLIKDEASPALQWASQYDKKAIRAKYLGDGLAGKGSRELLTLPSSGLSRSTSTLSVVSKNKNLPAPPGNESRAALSRSHSEEPVPVAPAPLSEPTYPVAATPPTVVEPAPIPFEPEVAVGTHADEEAAEIPLPPATPEITEEPTAKQVQPPKQPTKLRKSVDQQRKSPEQKKRGKTPSGPPPVQHRSGIRRLFGNKRSKSKEPKGREPLPASPVEEEDPAIAAARRALEGQPAELGDGPTSPPLSPGHFIGLANAKPPKAVQNQAPSTVSMSAPVETGSTPYLPTQPEPQPEHHYEQPVVPPRIHRDEEYDQLSRVDTNEREHADREFSTFDQGPLLDQPAFMPPETPTRTEFATPAKEMPQPPMNIHAAVTMGQEESSEDEDESPALTEQVSPTDRWAQIRKNAADRAIRQEEQTSRSRTETRTDDGETSGEETIESRVARIKARVAELTGNMDGTRR